MSALRQKRTSGYRVRSLPRERPISTYQIIHDLAKAVIPAPIWRRMAENRALGLRQAYAAGYASKYYKTYYKPQIDRIFTSIFETGEISNFIYDLNGHNIEKLAFTISYAANIGYDEAYGYIEEAARDGELRAAAKIPENIHCGFGRRLGWYIIARATKPKVIVETGVERGHGALILCAALLRNETEGYPGRYFGTDLNPDAGALLKGKYAAVGTVLYGDSITSLKALQETIGLFINDSDHSADYEYLEYQTVRYKLAENAFILGDNAHATNKLAQFSRETGRHFLYFAEQPQNHWYPGGGIGISFNSATSIGR